MKDAFAILLLLHLEEENATNDLAVVLRTPIESAEQLKLNHGSAMHIEDDKDTTVEVPGVNGRSPRTYFQRITRRYPATPNGRNTNSLL